MNISTPLLVITDVGLAAASVATSVGPFIDIVAFEVGSAYGYTPLRTDTTINGNLLFTGAPLSYAYVGNNTINILCQLPPDAGPFDFGELALFLPGNVMFAKCAFTAPQTKYSALGTNVVSTYTFNCLLKLEQAVAIFQFSTVISPPQVWEVDLWSDVYPPGISANPAIPLTLVLEQNENGDSSLLSNTSSSDWTLGSSSYQIYRGSAANNEAATFPVANASTTWVEIAADLLYPEDLTTGDRCFVIKTNESFYRSVSSVQTSGSNYRFNLNVAALATAPPIGSALTLYRDDGAVFYNDIIGTPPAAPLATVGNPGLAYGGSGLVMPTAGEITAYGLLHGPQDGSTWPGMGRKLTSADDINDTTLPSGCYDTAIGASGVPANWPPTSWDGILQIVNYGTITQTYFPEGYGGPVTGGVGGVPIWYRSYSNQANAWSDWFSVAVVGKSSPTSYEFLPQMANATYTPAPGSVQTLNLSFTAPCNGYVLAFGTENKSQFMSNVTGQGSTLMVVAITTSDSLSAAGQDHTQLSKTDYAGLQVNRGTLISINLTLTADAEGNFPEASLILGYTFYPAW